jgi:hypothetical protein
MDATGAGGMLAPKSLGEVVAFAQVMARADLALPKHLRKNDGACMAVAMQAMRWEMDPFAVANKSYSVNDRLAYEAQLVAAVVHTRAPIARRPDYEFTGQGPTRRCIVSCQMLDGTTKTYESPEFGQITTKNSPLWKSDPDQQLGYFAIRSWARRHAPEVILGVYTPDEVAEHRDMRQTQTAGLAARLAAAPASDEGFNASQAEQAVDATFEDAPAAEEADDFPGDRDAPQAAQEPRKEAPVQIDGVKPASQLLMTVAARKEAFEAHVRTKTSSADLVALRDSPKTKTLMADIDAGDPDEVGTGQELRTWLDDLIEERQRAERDAAKGGA